ncbi:VWA domain-containing protein [Haloferula sp. BvORR071]|uniref:vWA domain-containing protein n=1 Tax=Haloferula sp. BvORR071 TaxID=1396141 RepID=UPI00055384BA|nr:VWA domain-containing protein [Haloferula sp. BvORR071]
MLTLAYPWLLLLLALPFVVRALWQPHREPRPGLQVPFMERLARASGQQPGPGASVLHGVWWRWVVLPLAWIGIVLALARPQWIGPPVSKSVPMRDLLLAVDLSGSMETQDFTDAAGKQVDRLSAVKEVLDDFLAKRQGDRVGLIFFGSAPFVQAPFTEDLPVCRQLLDEAQTKMAGPQTAFGDAIGLAITMFDRSDMKERVLIALTDGNDTASQIPPAKAAEIAKGKGIVIHTVSVGDPRVAGEQALDVPALQAVASETGGIYSAASDRKQLEEIYNKLDALEQRKAATVSHRPKRDVFQWPLGIGVVASLVYQALLLLAAATRREVVPAVAEPGKEAVA